MYDLDLPLAARSAAAARARSRARRLADALVHARVLVDDVLQRELAGRRCETDAEAAQLGRHRIQMRPASQ